MKYLTRKVCMFGTTLHSPAGERSSNIHVLPFPGSHTFDPNDAIEIPQNEYTKDKVEVAVIGLGSAGTSAATALLSKASGIHVTAYESDQDRIGGGIAFQRSTSEYHKVLRNMQLRLLPRPNEARVEKLDMDIRAIVRSEEHKNFLGKKRPSRSEAGEFGHYVVKQLGNLPDKFTLRREQVIATALEREPNSTRKFKAYSIGSDQKIYVKKYHAVMYAVRDSPKVPDWLERHADHEQVAARFWEEPKNAARVFGSVAGEPSKTAVIAGDKLTSYEAVIDAVRKHDFAGTIVHVKKYLEDADAESKNALDEAIEILKSRGGKYAIVPGIAEGLDILPGRLSVEIRSDETGSLTRQLVGDAFVSAIGRTHIHPILSNAEANGILKEDSMHDEFQGYAALYDDVFGTRIYRSRADNLFANIELMWDVLSDTSVSLVEKYSIEGHDAASAPSLVA